jgi:disulfide bond formation protein DsbB
MPNCSIQRYAAIVVAGVLFLLGAIQAADPALLGISPVGARWLGIAAAVLGFVAGFLPAVHRSTESEADPVASIDQQITGLDREDRERLAITLERHQSSLVSSPPHWLPPEGGSRG